MHSHEEFTCKMNTVNFREMFGMTEFVVSLFCLKMYAQDIDVASMELIRSF